MTDGRREKKSPQPNMTEIYDAYLNGYVRPGHHKTQGSHLVYMVVVAVVVLVVVLVSG